MLPMWSCGRFIGYSERFCQRFMLLVQSFPGLVAHSEQV